MLYTLCLLLSASRDSLKQVELWNAQDRQTDI